MIKSSWISVFLLVFTFHTYQTSYFIPVGLLWKGDKKKYIFCFYLIINLKTLKIDILIRETWNDF